MNGDRFNPFFWCSNTRKKDATDDDVPDTKN